MTKFQYIKFLTKALFSKTKKWELQTGHTVKVGFISGGKKYYQLSDLFNTFTERGLDAYQVYEEISMRVSVDDLKAFVSKFENDLNTGKLMDCANTLSYLKERINFVIPPKELIWKMASVAYFDESESPYTYDTIYAQKKIKEWQRNGDVADFFLYQQLRNLIPLPELSKETYDILMGTILKIQNHQSEWMNTSGKRSETFVSNSTYKESKSEQNTTAT